MSSLIERVRSRRPITWLTLLGLLILPAVIGGALVLALANPTDRLDRMTAAIVNLDEPITVDGQYTPLGRQLTAGLVAGSNETESNLTWVISHQQDAEDGLANGTYQAVVTIPANFSSAATSAGRALQDPTVNPEEATISVVSAPDGRVADGLITQQIADAATGAMGTMITEATTENILLGFSTLGTELGAAADGADQLADGTGKSAAGAGAIPQGATALSQGAGELAGGADQLATGARSLGSGLDELSANTGAIGHGVGQIAAGLSAGADQIRQNGVVPAELLDSARQAADSARELANSANAMVEDLSELSQECVRAGAPTDFCDRLAEIVTQNTEIADALTQTANLAAGAADYLDQIAQMAPEQLAVGLDEAASGIDTIANNLALIAGGIGASADGARDLGTGAAGLGNGAREISSGAAQLATGAGELASSLGALATGTQDLADGLHAAVDAIPELSGNRATTLAGVIANPVGANSSSGDLWGGTAVPLLSAIALWFGALATFLVMRAISAHTLVSRHSSLVLALRSWAPAAIMGIFQGVLVAIVVQLVAQYSMATWWGFLAVAMLVGASFAAINQALVATLGGTGRWISTVVGVLALATGLLSTIPAWLGALGQVLPTSPASSALWSATNTGAITALIVWAVLSLGVTVVATARRRTTTVRQLQREAESYSPTI